ncbi:MAG: arabinose efflux permease family protein [Dactylosporangium sp.]|nr:arabinose efflux permease family protein [Dactylosporangium sp.]
MRAAALALVAFAGPHALWPVYLISLINSTGRIVGMSLGGVLVVAAGAGPLFAGNAVSFLVVVGALLLMRPREWHALACSSDAPVAARGVRAGFGYLLRQPVVLVTLALSLVLGCFGRNYQVTGMVGAPTLGWLSERFGARTALVFAGAVCLLACAVAAALLARLTAATTRRDPLYSRTSSGHQPPGLTRSPGYVRSSQPITTMSAVSAEASTDSPMTVIPKAAS